MQIKQTKILESIFQRSQNDSENLSIRTITGDRLFLSILNENRGHGSFILKRLLQDWELHQIRLKVERDLLSAVNTDQPNPDQGGKIINILNSLINTSNSLAGISAERMVNTGHLLFTIVLDKSNFSTRVLEQYGVTANIVKMLLSELPPNEDYYDDLRIIDELTSLKDNLSQPEGTPLNGEVQSLAPVKKSLKKESVLSKHGVDLTQMARDGKLDPVIGRDEEIERLLQILSRRKKNNPVLIGEPGVGKSAIVEALALRIVQKQVPYSIHSKRVFSLDINSLVAGTKYRGEFEEKIKALVDELTQSKDVILFIDEIHTIVGAGSTQGSLDTANILKPALARGELQCIGATTLNEYREHIESDGALERRFQKIIVEQSTPEQTIQILNNIKSHYEKHHGVSYTDDAVVGCVELTNRYMSDRSFPDKAIDVLDEAGSKAHLSNSNRPDELISVELELEVVANKKRDALRNQDYEQAVKIRNHQHALQERYNELVSQWESDLNRNPTVVSLADVEAVVSSITGVPVVSISTDEKSRLSNMNSALSSNVIGQQSAVGRVTRSIQRNRAGLKDPSRPIGVFMFVGPTGVGKTHLAQQLAEYVFDSPDALIRVDMSEYSEKHNVSRLIGSPPGYVGYGEGGQLTEKIRRRPYSVILLDEIEKAHPDIYNIMLQVFDQGSLTDGLGRKVDFRNTIIIMTSNVGSVQAVQKSASVGFTTGNKKHIDLVNLDTTYRKELERTFAPEFINRIDDIITFETLKNDDIKTIAQLELKRLIDKVARLGYTINVSENIPDCLSALGYQENYGVRSLKRSILDNIEEPLSEMIVLGQVNKGDQVNVLCSDNKIKLVVNQ